FVGRINPVFSEIRFQSPNANSYHNDLALGLQKRLNQGFVMQVAYTLSKTVDDGSGVTSTGDNFVQGQRGDYTWDMKLKRGLASSTSATPSQRTSRMRFQLSRRRTDGKALSPRVGS